jgi:hypothetical protein
MESGRNDSKSGLAREMLQVREKSFMSGILKIRSSHTDESN